MLYLKDRRKPRYSSINEIKTATNNTFIEVCIIYINNYELKR